MLSIFLHHQWLNFWRSRNANRSLAVQIIIGFFYFLIFVEIAAIGIFLPVLIRESMPGQDPITVYTSYILYYFLVGLLARFQMQELPSLSIQPYLTQNIPRRTMLRFLNVRSLIHVINFMPLFVFVPFTLWVIRPAYGLGTSLCFLGAMLSLVVNNHFLNMYIKRKTLNNPWWLVVMLLFILVLKGVDYLHIASVEKGSAYIFRKLLEYPVLCLVPPLLAWLSFCVNNGYLRQHLYLEELVPASKLKSSQHYGFLDRFGGVGDMIALDLKLLFRNKRPRSLVILSAVILIYGFIFYPQYLKSGNDSMLFLFAMLITGLFISNYGQFLFAWQSGHFDGIMTYNINMRQYIRAKFALFLTVCTIQFAIASLYGFMSLRLLPIQLAAYLYSVGVDSFLTIYVSTFHYKYLDLSKSASMNFQGIGAAQWLQSLAISFGPALVFFLIDRFAGFWIAIGVICALGLAGLIFREQLINWLAVQFNQRKHRILEGFRDR